MRKETATIMLAILTMASLSFMPRLAEADQYTWVRMHGQITQWGTTPVFGWLGAHARIVDLGGIGHDWAYVHAFWSSKPFGVSASPPPGENITYTFYAARLVNSSIVGLNYSGIYDFYVAGLWDVNKVTFIYYLSDGMFEGNFTCIIETILHDARGELRVFGGWSRFELDIDGIDLLSGLVRWHIVGSIDIRIGDVDGNSEINIDDLVHVAMRYGSMPGLGNFDFEIDFNLDNRIDVGDLATIAANIEI